MPYADFGDPQSLNLFSYIRNISTTRFDVDGHAGPPRIDCTNGDCMMVTAGCAGNYICSKAPPTNADGSPAPPPMSLPPGKNGETNSWVPKHSGKGARTKWGPKFPVKSAKGGQPSASWDEPNEHWDFKPGALKQKDSCQMERKWITQITLSTHSEICLVFHGLLFQGN